LAAAPADGWVDGVTLHALPTVSIDALADLALLDSAQRARAQRFVRPGDAAAYVALHAALRRVLAPEAPAALVYTQGPHGKPAARGGPEFSLSHCPGHAWVALSAGPPVGLDIEVPRPMAELAGMAAQVMTAAEHAAWLALPEDQRLAAFVRLWTRKEACLKCWGVGLSRSPAMLHTGWDTLTDVQGLRLYTDTYNPGCLVLSLALGGP